MSDNSATNKLLLILIAIFLSPLAVFLKEGGPTSQFIINLLLYLFCVTWPIAVLHAVWVIVKK